MDRRIRELLDQAEKAKKQTTAPAREVLHHVYRGILALPQFALADGTKARLDPYVEPEVGEDGQLRCGFDVLLDNGSHLEFMIENTGWGKALAPQRERPPPRRGREGPSHGSTQSAPSRER